MAASKLNDSAGSRRRHAWAVTVIVAGLVALSACSVQRLVYNNADWFVLERVDDYVSLDHVQRGRLSQALADALERHRREELPGIAEELDRVLNAVRVGLTREQARWIVSTTRQRGRSALAYLIEPLSEVLASLDDEQRTLLAENLDERNQDMRRTRLVDAPREERLARRTERTVDFIEDVTGSLSEQQVAIVASHRARMPDDSEDWLRYTEKRYQLLLAHLEGGADAAAIARLLERSFITFSDTPTRLWRNHYQRLDVVVDMLLALDASLSSAQRESTLAYLTRLRDDVRALAEQS